MEKRWRLPRPVSHAEAQRSEKWTLARNANKKWEPVSVRSFWVASGGGIFTIVCESCEWLLVHEKILHESSEFSMRLFSAAVPWVLSFLDSQLPANFLLFPPFIHFSRIMQPRKGMTLQMRTWKEKKDMCKNSLRNEEPKPIRWIMKCAESRILEEKRKKANPIGKELKVVIPLFHCRMEVLWAAVRRKWVRCGNSGNYQRRGECECCSLS